MPRKVLIVSPHFPPINAPDHQRVRMSLPYFDEFGWRAHILAVRPEYVGGIIDPLLEEALPGDIEITRVKALPRCLTRFLGLGSLGIRSFFHLFKKGNKLMKKEKFDLIYFSTTMFVVMALGPIWYKKFGVPYVLDFQDPWASDYYKRPNAPMPPGGILKYSFSQYMAHILEPRVMRDARHIISVSQGYVETFMKRYPWLKSNQFTVLPFGVAEADFDYLKQSGLKQSRFSPTDGNQHWVYVGRGGDDMAFSLCAFFYSLRQFKKNNSKITAKLKLHFIGTDYAPSNLSRQTVRPIAMEYGTDDLVEEQPQRIPYFEALRCLLDADALIVPGSDDPGYTASKIFPYIGAHKPLLAIFYEGSSVIDIINKTKSGKVVAFKRGDKIEEVASAITKCWFDGFPPIAPNTDWSSFSAYTAREMARKQCAVFDQSVSHGS